YSRNRMGWPMRVRREYVPRNPRRRGSLVIEALLLLPVVIFVLVAFVQLSLTIAAEQRLHEASLEGVRVACRGGSREDVAQSVRHVLGKGRMATARIDAQLEDEQGDLLNTGASIVVTVSIPSKEAVPLNFFGARDLVGRAVMRKE